uniref:Uncharacterized protein n=1 Tax=Avena sativa TaxID=4498 RepID=A0ACD5TR05_AVESA
MNSGLDWRTLYGIIKGMFEGVRYLHDEFNPPYYHLNIKPSNILMDEKMMPKIGDTGLDRIFDTGSTYRSWPRGMTIAYLPPEFINAQIISNKFDVFSLGIIMLQLLTGRKKYLELYDMPSQEFIDLTQERWRKRLHKTVKGTSVTGYCQQVKQCLKIAVNCVDVNRHKRPSMAEIIHMLEETEQCLTSQLQLGLASDQLLDVSPLELSFPSAVSLEVVPIITKKKVAMASTSCCPLQLQNKGDDRVAFKLVASNPKRYLTKKPLYGIVPPRCAYTLTLTMPSKQKHKQQQPPPTSSDNGGDFFTLCSIMLGAYDLLDAAKDSIKYDDFFKKAKESTASTAGEDDAMQEVMLKAICDPPADQGTSCRSEVISTPDAQQVSSIDVHPTEPWIMTTNHVGSLRVWDYRTMAALNSFQLVPYEPVHVAKFVAREKSIIAGDPDGGILVYNYENEDVHSFDAHDSCITTLAVHATSPLMLSSSEDDDHLIKLWDWGNDWRCTREFGGHTERVTQVTFNPENNDSFASASCDGTVKIWSICSDDPSTVITLKLDGYARRPLCVDYFTRHKRQHVIMGCEDKMAQIWALGIKGHVDMLEGHEDHITAVKLHPELPLLMTGSLDGTVRIWDSTTYTPENIIAFNLGEVYAFGCIKGSTRIVVGCRQGIATMELSSP